MKERFQVMSWLFFGGKFSSGMLGRSWDDNNDALWGAR